MPTRLVKPTPQKKGLDAIDNFLIKATKIGLFAMFTLFIVSQSKKAIATPTTANNRPSP